MTLDGGGAPAATLVVGAGLAGLTVAYRLQQYGVPVDVVEARDRPGGRIHSQPQALGTQLTAELGGEAFDSDHAACLTLAQALGLPVVDLWSQVPAALEDTLWFGGQRLSARQVQTEWAALLQERAADWQAVQQFLGDGKRTDRIAALDALSIPDYLDQCGAGATLRQVVTTAYTIKYGIEAEVQSSLNVLGYFQKLGDCEWLFGTSDERFYLQGGNGQLPAALYGAVGDRVHLGTALEALTATADGRYQATLRQGQTVGDRRYERVILTVPFSVLRHIDLRVELPAQKRAAIQQLTYNSPTKVISAHRHKPWQTHHSSNGMVYTDLPIQHCWEASDSLQSQGEALLVAYPGGAAGAAIARQPLAAAAHSVLADLHQIFPTLQASAFPPALLRSEWLTDPYSQGAYSCYQVGQWTAFYGCEGQRVGNLFFAGEHCSRLYQGYMEGACETAEQVVLEVLQDLGLAAAAQQRSRLQHHDQVRQQGFAVPR